MVWSISIEITFSFLSDHLFFFKNSEKAKGFHMQCFFICCTLEAEIGCTRLVQG